MSLSFAQRDRLNRAARRYGILTEYHDVNGEKREASPEALVAALQALGAEMETVDDAPDVYEARRWEEWREPCDPVSVAWGGTAKIEVRLPSRQSGSVIRVRIRYEDGRVEETEVTLKEMKVAGAARFREFGGIIARSVPLPFDVPPGYHRIEVELPESTEEISLISTPERAHTGPDSKLWGLFVPVYAIRSQDPAHWGAGNYSDLETLFGWVREQGGELVGTLPMLPTFLGEDPYDPSPYAPASRLFWNEFYIDPTRLPEWDRNDRAREIAGSEDFQRQIADLNTSDLVEYKRGMALRRQVLNELADSVEGDRLAAMLEWADGHRHARSYARFRATMDKRGDTFHSWPDRLRNGEFEDGDYDPRTERYYLYGQWVAEAQVQELATRARDGGSGLYIDLPLGVHGAGYDIWREKDLFVGNASLGAPPDPIYEEGQDWGFPPIHPHKLKAQAYRHFIEVIRHHMRHASTLRIDHVMGLHRQFWVPHGAETTEGVYVAYPADDLYAVVMLESHRNQTMVVGEDLGTVPENVRPLMQERGLYRMCVVPFAISRESEEFRSPPANAMASISTHDLPTATMFFEEIDGEERRMLADVLIEAGYLDPERTDDARALFEATTLYLAASDSKLLMVNLEDLWGETRRQNVPGTSIEEHPNWQYRARHTLEELREMGPTIELLRRIAELRSTANVAMAESKTEETSKIS